MKKEKDIIETVNEIFRNESEHTLAAHQKEVADMLHAQKKELYDNISLEIALRFLKISKWNLIFVIITFLISLYGILR